jgi:hypothetical protein
MMGGACVSACVCACVCVWRCEQCASARWWRSCARWCGQARQRRQRRGARRFPARNPSGNAAHTHAPAAAAAAAHAARGRALESGSSPYAFSERASSAMYLRGATDTPPVRKHTHMPKTRRPPRRRKKQTARARAGTHLRITSAFSS